MRKVIRASGLAFVVLLLAAGSAVAQNRALKVLEGKVFGSGSAPLPNAVVYLQSSKDNTIRTFIATQDGSYRFGQLSPDIDYEIWADLKGKKSSTKTLSSFDTKKQFYVDLHIDTK